MPDRTPEERAKIQRIRDFFQAEKPSLEELVASGEYAPPVPMGELLQRNVAVWLVKRLPGDKLERAIELLNGLNPVEDENAG